MTKFFLVAVLAGAALFVAACGGSGNSSDESQAAGMGGGSGTTVSLADVEPLGNVLVDSTGKTLYTSDVETASKILCTDACTSFWKPLEPGTSMPSSRGDVGKLAVINRPDGTEQVTANGHPLYTFAEDGNGEAKGDGFTDDFAGQKFVWHALDAGGTPASKSSSSGGSSNEYSPGNGY